jgi:hypothetical protein
MSQQKHDCVSRNTSQQVAAGLPATKTQRHRHTAAHAISAWLEDVRRAQSYLANAAELLRGVATAAPSMAQSLSDSACAAAIIGRSLDADVLALRDLADPKRGVR